MKNGLALIMAIAFCLVGCAAVLPPTIPVEDRVFCEIYPLTDLTGSYQAVSPSFESILQEKMKQDVVRHTLIGATSDRDVVISNIIYPRLEDSLDALLQSNKDSLNALKDIHTGYVLKGSAEIIQYGPRSDLERYVKSYLFFGMLGLASEAMESKDTRVGFVEYTFELLKITDSTLIDRFKIAGICESSQLSRSEIMKRANKRAAEDLVYRTNKAVYNVLGRKMKTFPLQ